MAPGSFTKPRHHATESPQLTNHRTLFPCPAESIPEANGVPKRSELCACCSEQEVEYREKQTVRMIPCTRGLSRELLPYDGENGRGCCRAGAGISATVLAQHIGEPGLNPQSCREEGKRDRGTRPEVSPSPPPTQAKARFSCSEDHQNGSEGKGGEFQALLPPEFILGVPRHRPRKRCTALWGSSFPVLAQPSTLTKTRAAKQPFKLKLKKLCGRYFKTEACFERAETEKKRKRRRMEEEEEEERKEEGRGGRRKKKGGGGKEGRRTRMRRRRRKDT